MKFSIPNEHRNSGGVYILRSTVTSDAYIGATSNFENRWYGHRSKGRNHSSLLSEYKVKYGGHTLVMEVLEICAKEDRQFNESKWINKLRPTLNMINGSVASLKKPEPVVEKNPVTDWETYRALVFKERLNKAVSSSVQEEEIETVGSYFRKHNAA